MNGQYPPLVLTKRYKVAFLHVCYMFRALKSTDCESEVLPYLFNNTRYSLSDLPTALDQLDRGAFGKIVLDVAR